MTSTASQTVARQPCLELQFVHCQNKYVLQCENCTALVIFGCILEQCFFYIGIVKRSSAKQKRCSVFGRKSVVVIHPDGIPNIQVTPPSPTDKRITSRGVGFCCCGKLTVNRLPWREERASFATSNILIPRASSGIGTPYLTVWCGHAIHPSEQNLDCTESAALALAVLTVDADGNIFYPNLSWWSCFIAIMVSSHHLLNDCKLKFFNSTLKISLRPKTDSSVSLT